MFNHFMYTPHPVSRIIKSNQHYYHKQFPPQGFETTINHPASCPIARHDLPHPRHSTFSASRASYMTGEADIVTSQWAKLGTSAGALSAADESPADSTTWEKPTEFAGTNRRVQRRSAHVWSFSIEWAEESEMVDRNYKKNGTVSSIHAD